MMQSLPRFPRSDDADDDGHDFFSGDIRNRHGWFGPAEVVLAQEQRIDLLLVDQFNDQSNTSCAKELCLLLTAFTE
jgi:hypothetical protein